MRIISALALLVVSMSLTAPVFAADSPEESAIKARQGVMHLRAFNAGPLFAMIKGDMPYDADMASDLATNLETMLSMKNGRMWMEGTSSEDFPDKSRALPAVWKSDSDIRDKGKKYSKAVNALADNAGQGLDTLKPRVKDLGQACKSCHDDYEREK